MKRFLISWVAFSNDFIGNKVNTNGPTFDFHKHFFSGYDAHILLTNENDNMDHGKGRLLFSELSKAFRHHNIIPQYLDMAKSDIIDYNSIHNKLYPIMLEYEDCEVDIFVSPGTPTMQVVWYMLHNELKQKTKLLQTVPAGFTIDNKPGLKEISMDNAPFAQFHLMKELRETQSPDGSTDYLISNSLKPIYDLAFQVAQTPKTTVLITGETGTGKEHLAEHVHQSSSRKNDPFLSINCAAIRGELLESRLFGYEKGTFTGALKSTDGLLQQAHKGTVFLDEIGDISPEMQVTLLRFIQSGELQRVGGGRIEKVDVRIVAATNKNLQNECTKGNFRWDLYYRLNVAELALPPLRDRGEHEISNLVNFFVEKYAELLGASPLLIDSSAIEMLARYHWPGNIRELQNIIERCYAYGIKIVDPSSIPLNDTGIFEESFELNSVIKNHIRKVVHQCNGNLSHAKRELNIGSINTIKKYLKDE